MLKLCVNIDHIATIREARKGDEPDPIIGAQIAIDAGANGITVHLREDRRHIQDRDVLLLSDLLKNKKNILLTLEMAATNEMAEIAKKIQPGLITLVPEKRAELTTEGGLNVTGQKDFLKKYIEDLHKHNLTVSIFIDADKNQINAAKEVGTDYIEIHTGSYANNPSIEELEKVKAAIEYGISLGLKVNAGHGLNYENTKALTKINGIDQLHIGHSIISRSVLYGIEDSIKKMIEIIEV